jgi:hypothetical protein
MHHNNIMSNQQHRPKRCCWLLVVTLLQLSPSITGFGTSETLSPQQRWLVSLHRQRHSAMPTKRRREYSCSLSHQNEESIVDLSTPALMAPTNQKKDLSSCPFAMAFPRYRIDLSSGKKKRNAVDGFLGSTRLQIDKLWIKKRFSNIRWIEPSTSSFPGIHASAAFWRAISNASRNSGEAACVLCLPGVPQLTARRLVDIYDWWLDRIADGTISGAPSIGVQLAEDGPDRVPILILSPLSQRQEENAIATACTEKSSTVEDSNIVEQRMKSWVRRILVDLGICPFTKSDSRSGQGLADLGVSAGKIAYHHSAADSSSLVELMADTWESIADMMEAGASGKDGISSILLAAPSFDNDFPLWAGPVFAMLESGVSAAAAEAAIGVVCFHPRYATPDGSSWPGFGHMHSVPRLRKWMEQQQQQTESKTTKGNEYALLTDEEVAAGGAWQRRTPHACINVLRADQLEAAEKRRTSASMYTTNIRTLVGQENGIGSIKLAQELQRERSMKNVKNIID